MINKIYLNKTEVVKTNLFQELRTARMFLKLNYNNEFEVVRCYSLYVRKDFLGYAIKHKEIRT